MTEELDIFVSVHGIAITAATLADLVDDVARTAEENGGQVLVRLTVEQARRLPFYANELACRSQRLERAMEEGTAT